MALPGPAGEIQEQPTGEIQEQPTGDIRIAEKLVFGGNPLRAAHAVRLLRDNCCLGRPVRWRGRAAGVFDVGALVHLPPPEELTNAPGAAEEWRERHRYGLFYFRVGPGFILVKDQRNMTEAARFVIDDPDIVDVFKQSLAPTMLSRMGKRQLQAAQMLCDEGLLLRTGDVVVTLPARLRRWPVPFRAI